MIQEKNNQELDLSIRIADEFDRIAQGWEERYQRLLTRLPSLSSHFREFAKAEMEAACNREQFEVLCAIIDEYGED